MKKSLVNIIKYPIAALLGVYCLIFVCILFIIGFPILVLTGASESDMLSVKDIFKFPFEVTKEIIFM